MQNNNVTLTNDKTAMSLSIIPVSNTKNAIRSWKQYQQLIAPAAEWQGHYVGGGYVGIICGKVSGNLEVIDIDVKNDPYKTIYQDYCNLIPKKILNKLVIQTTPSKGYHFIYRCEKIEGNLKLANTATNEVILETRGEGGYICHHCIDYKVIQGTFDLFGECDIPVITLDERELLMNLARTLDRTDHQQSIKEKKFTYTEPAINQFNNNYNVIELFKKHDWEVFADNTDKVILTRPGSIAQYSGYYYKNDKFFICFSTSTEFKAQQPYNPFQILQLLEGKNDYSTTLRLIASMGYELQNNKNEKKEKNIVTSDDIADYLNQHNVKYDVFTNEVTIKNKHINNISANTLFVDIKKHFNKKYCARNSKKSLTPNILHNITPF
jgi:hypothetical protein